MTEIHEHVVASAVSATAAPSQELRRVLTLRKRLRIAPKLPTGSDVACLLQMSDEMAIVEQDGELLPVAEGAQIALVDSIRIVRLGLILLADSELLLCPILSDDADQLAEFAKAANAVWARFEYRRRGNIYACTPAQEQHDAPDFVLEDVEEALRVAGIRGNTIVTVEHPVARALLSADAPSAS